MGSDIFSIYNNIFVINEFNWQIVAQTGFEQLGSSSCQVWLHPLYHRFIFKEINASWHGLHSYSSPAPNFDHYTPLNVNYSLCTLPIAEILSGKNVRAFLVCGFLMKSFNKNILKIWKKSWEPFGSYLLNSTANPAHFHPNWAGLAVLFSR